MQTKCSTKSIKCNLYKWLNEILTWQNLKIKLAEIYYTEKFQLLWASLNCYTKIKNCAFQTLKKCTKSRRDYNATIIL